MVYIREFSMTVLLCFLSASAFIPAGIPFHHPNDVRETQQSHLFSSGTEEDTAIVSPFEGGTAGSSSGQDEFLDLTEENVELVLDEMRPFLQADGGDVALTEIDGPVVRLELQVIIVYLSCLVLFFVVIHAYYVMHIHNLGCLWHLSVIDANNEDGVGNWT